MRVGGGRGGGLRLDGRVTWFSLFFFIFFFFRILVLGFLNCVATSFLALVFGVGGDGFLE